MCEQHKLQVAHRRGLPDWTLPSVPAGISTSEHERVPTFFAWERADAQPAHAPGNEVAERPVSIQVRAFICSVVRNWILTLNCLPIERPGDCGGASDANTL